MQKILIYTEKITPRIQYVFDFILREFSGLDFELTNNIQLFDESDCPKISYSDNQLADEIHLVSDEFMLESEISGNIRSEYLHPIGKIFYTLCRYEEYLSFDADRHGRFPGKGRAVKTPFADSWILEFQKELKTRYPQLEFKKREFGIVLTCDVDQVWKYKHKGFKRTFGAYLKDFVKLDFTELAKRKRIISGHENDPFDTFGLFQSFLDSLIPRNDKKYRMIFFWLMGDYGKFDKNNPTGNRYFQMKIKEISDWAECGIHPSYASNSQPEKLQTEIKRLENILGEKVTKSRQHYIRISFPVTYRNLLRNGITDDYTLAYADETGFRAGTCTPFFWYDLEAEKQTDLKIHPFCAMDVSMRNYMGLSVEESIAELQRLKKEIQKVDGQMIVLFHNSNFHDGWEGWGKVIESLFE